MDFIAEPLEHLPDFHRNREDVYRIVLGHGHELALAIHDMAMFLAAEGVTDAVHYGAYNCRVISGTTTISQQV